MTTLLCGLLIEDDVRYVTVQSSEYSLAELKVAAGTYLGAIWAVEDSDGTEDGTGVNKLRLRLLLGTRASNVRLNLLCSKLCDHLPYDLANNRKYAGTGP